jgi:predicted nucleic acid-binding protein
MYLLDTNVVSELRRLKPHPKVVAWLRSIPEAQLRLSAVTLGEIQRGIENLRGRDASKAAEIERWADKLEATCAVLPVDAGCFRAHARLMRQKPAPAYEDALIAAVAIRHGLTVVTRNVEDFGRFDAPILNPFEAAI